jgi:hypothetical protein
VSPIRQSRIVAAVPTNEDIATILDSVARVEWRNLELKAGCVSSAPPFAPARYRLTLNNVVYMQGRIERTPGLTNGDIGTVIAQVDDDALPGGDLVFACPTGQIQNFARLIVRPSGELVFGGLLIAANPAAKEINLSQIVYSIEGEETFAVQQLNALKEGE